MTKAINAVRNAPNATPPGLKSEKFGVPPSLAEQVHDDLDERVDDLGERGADDDGDREVDDVAPHQEVLETLDHARPFLCPRTG